MFSVNTNVGALAALQSLSQTQADLTSTQNAIATGQKVSSASDNPAIYAIGQAMNARIAGLSAVSDNLNFASSVITTAQSAATAISSQLATLKSTVTEGQQDGIDAKTINNQITSILTQINSIANSATFNGVNIVGGSGTDNITGSTYNGTAGMNVVQDISGTTFKVNAYDTTTTGLGLNGLTNTSNAATFSFSSTAAFANKDDFKITGTYTDASGASAVKTWDFILSDGTTTQTATDPSASANTTFVNINATDSSSAILQKLSSTMASQGFGATIDTSGKLVVTGNGLTAATSTLATGTATALVAPDAIATVDGAIKNLSSMITGLGSSANQVSTLQTFSSSLSTALTEGLGALTDADMTTESAKLQSLQTKQSLGIQALSIANTQPQSLLTLFR
mgnify:CR=1 FL=1